MTTRGRRIGRSRLLYGIGAVGLLLAARPHAAAFGGGAPPPAAGGARGVGSSDPAAAQEAATFKVGDCVEFDTTNAMDSALRWRKGWIAQDDGYFFTIAFDAREGGGPESTTVSLASAHKWLRAAVGCRGGKPAVPAKPGTDAGKAPPEPPRRAEPAPGTPSGACPFTKGYMKVSKDAPASADLFKGVIFEWEHSLNKRFRDFGLTFLSFQMGKPFENRVYPGIEVRKDVDTAPVGATIYPLKVKELVCQKDISITIRRVWEIEYSCYKDKVGDWVCRNNAPRQLEHETLPNP